MPRGICISNRKSQIANRKSAFSLVELLVVIGIFVLLLAIFIPYFMKIRESDQRSRCNDNLRRIGIALTAYARDNGGVLPRVVYDEASRPYEYTAFTGPDAANPFVSGGRVAPNDVTASLWLLVRRGYIPSAAFVCPSSSDYADAGLSAAGQAVPLEKRSNFRGPRHLSYGYASPFSNATHYGLTDSVAPGFVLLADAGPRISEDNPMPPHAAPPLELARGNSRNHGGAGQWVLYSEMSSQFVTTPYTGINGDNIYTAQAKTPVFDGVAPDPLRAGYDGSKVGPATATDSYLVPNNGFHP